MKDLVSFIFAGQTDNRKDYQRVKVLTKIFVLEKSAVNIDSVICMSLTECLASSCSIRWNYI